MLGTEILTGTRPLTAHWARSGSRSAALRSDEDLTRSIQRGEAEALNTLVARHHSLLLGYLYRLTGGDRALAEDLAAER